MSALTQAHMQAQTPTPSTSRAAGGWIRRHRAALVIGAGLVLATAMAVLGGTQSTRTAPLDPENYAPDGSRALAQVLEQQGISVDIVRGADAFDAVKVTDDTSIVVTSTEQLGQSTWQRLREHAGDNQVVVVGPGVGTLLMIGADEGVKYRGKSPIPAACDDSRFSGLRIRIDAGRVFPAAEDSCFVTAEGAALVEKDGVTVLGADDILTNEAITRSDNAAAALRLLGTQPHLIWYVPDFTDLLAGDAVGLGSLLPDWLTPGLWLAAITMIAVILWRGRRLGPLVREPLPVAVTAIETTESRGRLYRKINDRTHAAEVLRRGARTRIATHLQLPRSTDPDALIQNAALHSNRTVEQLTALLSPTAPAPSGDKDLTRLASDLAELEKEVRNR